MSDGFRYSAAPRPEGVPVSAEEAERILRTRVAEERPGSPQHRDALWQLVRFLGVTGRAPEGLEILDRLLTASVDAQERPQIVLAMGQLLEKMSDYESAAATYGRGVQLGPAGQTTAFFLRNNLGYCLNHLGRHREAERWCRAAIEIDPLRYNAHKNLGLAFQGQGRYAEAARSLIQAVRLEAADPRALGHLEALVNAHPEIESEIPDLGEQLESCVTAVTAALLLRDQATGAAQSQSN
jgi:tetratricopeptide (TPR) repeat protein